MKKEQCLHGKPITESCYECSYDEALLDAVAEGEAEQNPDFHYNEDEYELWLRAQQEQEEFL